MQVLVIEDDPSIQAGYERLLRRMYQGLNLWVADNAYLAVELLRHYAFDLVLSDYDLYPTSDRRYQTGGDVLEWIKTNSSHYVKQFIFVSGNEIVCNLHSPELVFVKPCSMNDLGKTISRVCCR